MSSKVRAHNLFFAVLVAGYEVDSFHVPNIHFVTENVREDHFSQVLLFLIAIQIAL